MTLAKSELFEVSSRIAANSLTNQKDFSSQYQNSIEDPKLFWSEQAKKRLSWIAPFDEVLEWDYNSAKIRWFINGKINVCYNCIDRHLPHRAAQTAIIWEGDTPGLNRYISYSELLDGVSRLANVLKDQGVKKGDRVAIYMPMVPEAAFAMLACARIGAIHSVIFAGFSAESVRDRILDSQCKILITANDGVRGGKRIPLKEIADQAVAATPCVTRVLVHRRTDNTVSMISGRDLWLDEEMQKVSPNCPIEPMDSEDPLFILYTSGSTGKPKGAVHTQAGYLLYAGITHQLVFDYHEGDIYCCAADIGWITGHSYIVYGPLSNGATTMMFESIPTFPDPGRYWDMVERHKINIFYTAPTAIRAIAKEGNVWVEKHDLSSLRVLGSVGEPINRDAWLWYYNVVGKTQCALVDTWWQTETGGILITPIPGVTPLKPGSATFPFLGVQPCIVDEVGNELSGNNVTGRLCIKFPWPGQMRTVYGDHQRFIDTYFKQYPGKYFTGDACIRDGDGYYWITGRVDDVLIVSGHRLGTAEIESAIVSSGIVAEAAVVGMPHDIKGVGIYAYCILKNEIESNSTTTARIRKAVRDAISPIAIPDVIQFVPGLPKTRSGKIMRRILRKIAAGENSDLGDTSTLADPSVVESIIGTR